MPFYKTFIAILTFLVINIPIFMSLNKYVFMDTNTYTKLLIGLLYWPLAFLTQQLIPFIGVLILLSKVHSRENDDSGMRDINIWAPNFGRLAAVVGVSAVFKILVNQLNSLYVFFLTRSLDIEIKPQEIVGEFEQGGFIYKAALLVLVVVLAPFVEEYVFRYFVYDRILLPKMPSFAAALISASLFTLLHYNISGIPTFFCLGLFCCFIYEKTGFYGAVIAHAVSNLMTAVFLI